MRWRVERLLVDLDPEARARRAGGASRRAARTRPTAIVDGEEALGGEAVGEAGVVGAGRLAQRLGDLGRRGDPDRAVEGAGEIGGEDLGDLDRRLGPADLRELHPASPQAPIAAARSASARLSTLSSAAIGIEVALATSASLLERRDRLLGQLDVERLQLGQRPHRRPRRPRRRWRRPGSAPPARPPRAPPHLADVVAGAELQLEGREALAPPSAARPRRPRPARRRPGSRCSGTGARLGAAAAATAAARRLRRAGRAARSAPRSGAGRREAARTSRRQRRLVRAQSDARRAAPARATTCASVRPAPQRQRHRLAEPDQPSSVRSRSSTISRRSSRPRAVT